MGHARAWNLPCESLSVRSLLGGGMAQVVCAPQGCPLGLGASLAVPTRLLQWWVLRWVVGFLHLGLGERGRVSLSSPQGWQKAAGWLQQILRDPQLICRWGQVTPIKTGRLCARSVLISGSRKTLLRALTGERRRLWMQLESAEKMGVMLGVSRGVMGMGCRVPCSSGRV